MIKPTKSTRSTLCHFCAGATDPLPQPPHGVRHDLEILSSVAAKHHQKHTLVQYVSIRNFLMDFHSEMSNTRTESMWWVQKCTTLRADDTAKNAAAQNAKKYCIRYPTFSLHHVSLELRVAVFGELGFALLGPPLFGLVSKRNSRFHRFILPLLHLRHPPWRLGTSLSHSTLSPKHWQIETEKCQRTPRALAHLAHPISHKDQTQRYNKNHARAFHKCCSSSPVR